jgi:hypothetical protein
LETDMIDKPTTKLGQAVLDAACDWIARRCRCN